MNEIIGRKKEKAILFEALESNEAEMISVIGRRRVGKTFLIETVYAKNIAFEITGVQYATKKEQLTNFVFKLETYSKSKKSIPLPKNWLEAFVLLIKFLEKKRKKEKMVIFLDELPWLATNKSGFLKGLSFFWNSWAVRQSNIVVVLCGSAASWMIQKVVHNRGGLYNRLTKRIILEPFTLNEVETYLQKRKINLDRYQIVQLYMTIGGIPHYWKEVKSGQSVSQVIDTLCFSSSGLLKDEFDQLYPALFKNSDNHIAVVRALATKWKGLTRKKIIELSKLPNGGGLNKVLDELIYSGFISSYFPFAKKKKEKLFRLTDEYSLFYLKFMENEETDNWKGMSQTPSYKSWLGYAFESVCLKHIKEIKRGLNIAGLFSKQSSFYHQGADGMDGCQIDLLIDRNDNVINLCEIKFANAEFAITKSYAKDLRTKMTLFKYYSKTKKQVFITFITTYGVLSNKYKGSIIDSELTLDSLFE